MTPELYQQSGPTASESPQSDDAGPVACLRTIRQVIEDPELSHAQASVIIAIILRADNQNATAWAAYRELARRCRASTSTVRLAIQKAGKYLEPAGVGKQGAKRYKVRAQRPEKRSEGESASTTEAPRSDHRSASASIVATKLAPITNPLSSPRKKTAATPSGSQSAAAAVTLPQSLDTPEFRKAWADWHRYRGERRRPLSPMSEQRQLAVLAKAGPDSAIDMIEASITHGWQGLFELKGGTNAIHGQPATAGTRQRQAPGYSPGGATNQSGRSFAKGENVNAFAGGDAAGAV